MIWFESGSPLWNFTNLMVIIRICSAAVLLAGTLSLEVAARNTSMNSAAFAQRAAKQMYRRQCVACHGVDGRAQTSKGKFSHARDLSDAKWQDDVTDERIFNSIMNGRSVRGNMPAFGDRFSEAQVNLMVKFVRGLRK
jgi:mono/diheme cytochrome c family protein